MARLSVSLSNSFLVSRELEVETDFVSGICLSDLRLDTPVSACIKWRDSSIEQLRDKQDTCERVRHCL